MTDDLRRDTELRALRERVRVLESGARAAVCGTSAALLVVGLLVPYIDGSVDGEVQTDSLLTFGLGAVAYRSETGAVDGPTMLLAVGFLGLVVMAVLSLVALWLVGRPSPEAPSRRWVRPVVALTVVGGLVAGALALVARNTDDGAAHSGIVWFLAGCAVLVGATSEPIARLGRDA